MFIFREAIASCGLQWQSSRGAQGKQAMTLDSSPRSASVPARSLRSWLRYRIGTLILVTVGCALVVTWWRQWKQSAELAKVHDELKSRTDELEVMEAIHKVNRAIDLSSAEHRLLFELLNHFGSWPFSSVVRRALDDNSEIIHLQNDFLSIPGSDLSVTVLLGQDKIIDILTRESSTREETHEATLEDIDKDGVIDVVLHCESGIWCDFEAFTLSYAVTPEGFGAEVKRLKASSDRGKR
jgi:hypothetical protein